MPRHCCKLHNSAISMKHKVKSRQTTKFGMSNIQTSPGAEIRFLNKAQLAKRLNLPNARTVDYLIAAKRIPVLRLGHRTVRFDWMKVEQALAKSTVNAAG
jgi:hypothetical protein